MLGCDFHCKNATLAAVSRRVRWGKAGSTDSSEEATTAMQEELMVAWTRTEAERVGSAFGCIWKIDPIC